MLKGLQKFARILFVFTIFKFIYWSHWVWIAARGRSLVVASGGH